MWRRNGWSNPVASAGLRLQSCAQQAQARTRPAPGPHQAIDFGVERGRISDFGEMTLRVIRGGPGRNRARDFFRDKHMTTGRINQDLQTHRSGASCALFGPKESGDKAVTSGDEFSGLEFAGFSGQKAEFGAQRTPGTGFRRKTSELGGSGTTFDV